MKKKIIIAIAAILVTVTLLCAGCSLFSGSTNDLANSSGSSGTTQNVTTYTNVSKSDLEEALTNYRAIAETLNERISALEDAVLNAVGNSETNIGAYASVYTDCLLNITCEEKTKASASCQGTGFIITADGYLLTNNHVVTFDVQEADYDNLLGYNWRGQAVYGTKTVSYVYSSVTATFDAASKYYQQGKSYTITVLYNDPSYDLALCKIVDEVPVGTEWKAIPFYEGEEVARGGELLVLGNARGFGLSATSGLISATGKTFSDYPKLTFIQTDAAINGGNSGGPAINIYGGLVGVVNSKFVSVIKNSYFSSEIEDVEGMGFAIELECVKEFLTAAQTAKSITVSYSTVKAPAANTESAVA